MKVRFITLGCKVNQYESEAMLEMLLGEGFQSADPQEAADVVVLNSCTVTAASDQKARQSLRRARRENPGCVLVLTGCWPQAFPEEAADFLEADIVLGTANRRALLPHILEFLSTGQRVVDIQPHEKGEPFERLSVSGMRGRTRAFLKIQDGCDRFCSYCIIPYARGRSRSKPLDELAREAAELAAHGYRELVLTGINLPSYGEELGLSLCDAVEAACRPEGVLRLRLSSLEPERLTDEVVERLRRQEKLCPQFHLSLQSGCDATLKRMNRHYDAEEYRRIVRRLREAFPGCAVTTDVMVGFAGETEEEFAQSLAFVKEIGFARCHVFAYSRRPGTRAFHAPDQVPNKIKEARSRAMIAAARECQLAFHRQQVGKTEPVLFEQEADPGLWEGYTAAYVPLRVPSPLDLRGKLLPVEITEAGREACLGKLTKNSSYPL